jgi:hypothetical protein
MWPMDERYSVTIRSNNPRAYPNTLHGSAGQHRTFAPSYLPQEEIDGFTERMREHLTGYHGVELPLPWGTRVFVDWPQFDRDQGSNFPIQQGGHAYVVEYDDVRDSLPDASHIRVEYSPQLINGHMKQTWSAPLAYVTESATFCPPDFVCSVCKRERPQVVSVELHPA